MKKQSSKMNGVMVLLLFLAIGITSCKNPENGIDKLDIVKQFYMALDNSNDSVLATLLTDSLLTKEIPHNYEQIFSLKEYVEWLKWDSVFDPTYEILQIDQENEVVKVRISKIDKRTLFLHEEPIVTNQIIRFDKDKITRVETTEYVIFNLFWV